MTTIRVEWVTGNSQWCIIGGGLPRGTCWSTHDSREEAEQEARAIAYDIGCEFED